MQLGFIQVFPPPLGLMKPWSSKIRWISSSLLSELVWPLGWEIWTGIAQSVWRLATGWTVRGSNPGGGRDFPHCPDRPWGPRSLPYNWYRVSLGGNAAGAWRWPPTLSGAEVKERVELHLYSPSGPSWPLIGWALPLLYLGWEIGHGKFSLRKMESEKRNVPLGHPSYTSA
jgi:hypothetical protein